jgi:hypothetical protein
MATLSIHRSKTLSNLDHPSKDFSCSSWLANQRDVLPGIHDNLAASQSHSTMFLICSQGLCGKIRLAHQGSAGISVLPIDVFELGIRKDVDALSAFLIQHGMAVIDPPGGYGSSYYTVYFADPDGMKLEGMCTSRG